MAPLKKPRDLQVVREHAWIQNKLRVDVDKAFETAASRIIRTSECLDEHDPALFISEQRRKPRKELLERVASNTNRSDLGTIPRTLFGHFEDDPNRIIILTKDIGHTTIQCNGLSYLTVNIWNGVFLGVDNELLLRDLNAHSLLQTQHLRQMLYLDVDWQAIYIKPKLGTDHDVYHTGNGALRELQGRYDAHYHNAVARIPNGNAQPFAIPGQPAGL